MSRRIDIELTSTRPDGSWTWRAAGAKQPKGEVDGAMLPAGAKIGDVLRVDTESYLEGLSVTAILPTKGVRTEPERIDVVGTRRNEELVTSTLVEKRGRRDADRRPRGDRPDGDRRPRGDRPDGDRRPPRTDRPTRPEGERRGPRPEGAGRPDGDRRPPRIDRPARPEGERRGPRPEGAGARSPRRDRPAPPLAPKVIRLRPSRAHRNAALAELPDAQRPIAEQILRGGVPAVRQAIDKQNEAARAEGQPEVRADSLVAFAEQLMPRLRAAEWRDKADAALAGIDEIDLRDIRTVVVAADTAARDEESRALAQRLREGLSARVDGEHAKWLAELTELVGDGRTIRALRLSSHPPKAGAPLPTELAERLAATASTGLTADITQDRWATLVDAVAFSPVRLLVRPEGVPSTVGDELKANIARLASRIPQVAELFGIVGEETPARRGPGVRGRRPVGAPPRPPAPRPAPNPQADEPVASEVLPVDAPVPVETTDTVDVTVIGEPTAVSAPTAVSVPTVEAVSDEVVSDEAVSDDGAQNAIVVQELGETIDQA